MYVLFAMLFWISGTFATTSTQAVQIYYTLIRANNFYNHPKLVFSNKAEMNAHETSQYIVINQGMLDKTNIDELAFVIGHELAHYKLGHVTSNFNNEFAADRLGYYLALKAGYNPHEGKSVFKKFKQAFSGTHPHPADRYQALH